MWFRLWLYYPTLLCCSGISELGNIDQVAACLIKASE